MAKIESLPLNVVLNLTKQELMSACGTTDVTVCGVGYAYGYEDDANINDYKLLVHAIVVGAKNKEDSGLHHWMMVWNEEECDFHTVMRLDQKVNNRG